MRTSRISRLPRGYNVESGSKPSTSFLKRDQDVGCELHSSCLECPYEECMRHDSDKRSK